jgi:thioredoxin-related protein
MISAVTGTLLLALSPALGQERNAAWRSDYDSARKEAVNKGLPLFLVVYSDSCVHCQRLEAGPLRDRGVVELLNQRFVPIRVNGAKAPRLIEALRIQAFPTLVVAATDGKVITFLEGYQEPRTLAVHLQQALTAPKPDKSSAEKAETKAMDRARRAKDLLAEARAAYAAEKYSAVLEACAILETTYKDLEDGKRAAELAAEIRSSPENSRSPVQPSANVWRRCISRLRRAGCGMGTKFRRRHVSRKRCGPRRRALSPARPRSSWRC